MTRCRWTVWRGLTVRARQGSFEPLPPVNRSRLIDWSGRRAPRPPLVPTTAPTSAAAAALASPVPLVAVPMRVFAAPYKTSREENVTVVIEIPASGLDFDTRPDGTLTARLNVAIGATSGLRTLRSTEYAFDVRPA